MSRREATEVESGPTTQPLMLGSPKASPLFLRRNKKSPGALTPPHSKTPTPDASSSGASSPAQTPPEKKAQTPPYTPKPGAAALFQSAHPLPPITPDEPFSLELIDNLLQHISSSRVLAERRGICISCELPTLTLNYATRTFIIKNQQLLGRGEQGSVYQSKIHEIGMDEPSIIVAVKQYHLDLASDKDNLLGKEPELVKHARVESHPHPNLMRLHASFEIDNFPTLLFLNLCENGTLEAHIKKGSFNTRTFLEYARERIIPGIVKGLRHLHSFCLFHLDLTQKNVLLDGEYNGIISDFGCSLPYTTLATEGAYHAGSYYISSPETILLQKYDDFDLLCRTTDIWALGILLKDILSISHPTSHLLDRNYGAQFERIGDYAEFSKNYSNPTSVDDNFAHYYALQEREFTERGFEPGSPEAYLNDIANCCLLPNPKERPMAAALLNERGELKLTEEWSLKVTAALADFTRPTLHMAS
jgi:hypothetical protein